MISKSKVVKIERKKSFDTVHGTLYPYTITFENGDVADYNSKSDNQNKFIIDQEIEYEIEKKNGFWKCKPVQQQNNFKKNIDSDAILYQVALKEAREIAIHENWNNLTEMKDKLKFMTDIAYQLAVNSKTNIEKLKKK